MKKILLLIALCLSLAGCGSSSVSQEEYDAVVAERDELKVESEKTNETEVHPIETAVDNQEKEEDIDGGFNSSENELNILAHNDYYIGEDKFSFVFGENSNGNILSITCTIDDKSDAFATHITLNSMMNSEDADMKSFLEEFNFRYSIIIGDGTFIIRSLDDFMVTKDSKIISVEEYFSTEWLTSEEYNESDYGTQFVDYFTDFIQNY